MTTLYGVTEDAGLKHKMGVARKVVAAKACAHSTKIVAITAYRAVLFNTGRMVAGSFVQDLVGEFFGGWRNDWRCSRSRATLEGCRVALEPPGIHSGEMPCARQLALRAATELAWLVPSALGGSHEYAPTKGPKGDRGTKLQLAPSLALILCGPSVLAPLAQKALKGPRVSGQPHKGVELPLTSMLPCYAPTSTFVSVVSVPPSVHASVLVSVLAF